MEFDNAARSDGQWRRRSSGGARPFESKLFWSLIAVIVAIALAWALYRYTHQEQQPAQVATAPATPVQPERAPPADNAAKYPVPVAGDARSLPPLNQSNAYVQDALKRLIGGDLVGRFVYSDEIIRRFVATVDNLPRKGSLTQLRALKPPPGLFMTTQSAQGPAIDPANASRYAPYVRLAESVDTSTITALYFRLYPLFEEQYRLLGYPNGHFNDRLIEAIDDMLAAPDVQPPIALDQPGIMYRFADPDLEQLSAGRKAMIRLGPDNAGHVKTKLRDLRQALSSVTR